MAIILARQSDPFKKYWWMILLLFGAVGLWVCYPALGGNAGLSIASAGSGLRPANQSLDPSANPNGAPGGPVNLSMDNSGPYRKKTSEDPFASLLFSPPPETSSPASPTTASSAAQKKSSWADALAQIAQRGAADAAPTAQIAAAFPTAKFGSLSGLSGSETSSAFSSGSVGPSRGLGAFGSAKPNIGISYTHGLSNSNSTPSSSQNSMAVLQNAAKTMKSALNSFNPSQAGAITSQVFDGGELEFERP